MGDPGCVGRGEDAGDLAPDVRELHGSEAARTADPGGEGLTFQELHDQVGLFGMKADVEDPGDPRVLDPAHDAGLVEQPVHVVGVLGDLGQQNFHRHPGLDPHVLRDEHLSHPTPTQECDHTEVADHLTDHVGRWVDRSPRT